MDKLKFNRIKYLSVQITLVTNIETFTCEDLEKCVLKKSLHMDAPDVVHNDRIILSSEEGETTHNDNKTLAVSIYINGCINKICFSPPNVLIFFRISVSLMDLFWLWTTICRTFNSECSSSIREFLFEMMIL